MRSNSASNSQKGREGEGSAVEFLERSGYRVVARNARLPGGEVDAICLDGDVLVFVEVKRRDTAAFGPAVAGVDRKKRSRLRTVAADYAQVVAPDAPIRFDVVAIDGNRITLHRNAF